MHKQQKAAYQRAMSHAKQHYATGEYDLAFEQLEIAHIIGQSYTIAHTISHWWMLKIAFKRTDFKEIKGQIFRILGSLFVSRIWVPLGNTGGANVSPFLPMPISKEIAKDVLNKPSLTRSIIGVAILVVIALGCFWLVKHFL